MREAGGAGPAASEVCVLHVLVVRWVRLCSWQYNGCAASVVVRLVRAYENFP
jgi:hypothetical protein